MAPVNRRPRSHAYARDPTAQPDAAATARRLGRAAKAYGSFAFGFAVCVFARSEITVQIPFALRYAHQDDASDESTPDEGDVVGGLAFPGDEEPDDWDVLHFVIVMGVASQAANIAFPNRRLCHTGTVHSLLTFTFTTVVPALAIDLLAGLL